jgi:hypothetical protein
MDGAVAILNTRRERALKEIAEARTVLAEVEARRTQLNAYIAEREKEVIDIDGGVGKLLKEKA